MIGMKDGIKISTGPEEVRILEVRNDEATDMVNTEKEEYGRIGEGKEGEQEISSLGGELVNMETDETTNKENQGGCKIEGKRLRRVHSGPRELRTPLREINGTKRKFQLRDEEMADVENQDHIDKKYRGDQIGGISNERIEGGGISPHWSPKDQ